MPPFIFLILNGLTAAITAAPQVIEIVDKGKALITSLVSADLITDVQQDQLHERVDKISEAVKRGEKPPAWDVEPDPETPGEEPTEPPVP